jgi:hypothetical protein
MLVRIFRSSEIASGKKNVRAVSRYAGFESQSVLEPDRALGELVI